MMSQSRFNLIYSGMTSIARKVYAVVPMRERWQVGQIIAEFQRSGQSADYRVIAGCLNTLIAAGLVHEPRKGEFSREPIRVPSAVNASTVDAAAVAQAAIATTVIVPPSKSIKETMQPKTQLPATSPTVAKPKDSPVDKLGLLAQRANGTANLLKELASEIGDAAIEIQEMLETNDLDVQKMKQLQSLLKSLG